MKIYLFLFDICESLKFPAGNVFSRIRFIKAIPYIWYLLISRIENVIVAKAGIMHCTLNKSYREESIIASLTTYPARINIVHLTIRTIFMQTMRPDRIVLWLAEEQFPDKQLPDDLLRLQKQGLEIRFCEDYRSHKKYFLALQEQKESEVVITFDDDILYDPHTIERAYLKHLECPRAVVVNQAMIPLVDDKGELGPYSSWTEVNSKNYHQQVLSPLTGSGCLYSFSSLTTKAFDWNTIKKNAKFTDDLWIFFQCLLAGTPILLTQKRSKIFTVVKGSQTSNLSQQNCIGEGNNKSLMNLKHLYPEVVNVLKQQKL